MTFGRSRNGPLNLDMVNGSTMGCNYCGVYGRAGDIDQVVHKLVSSGEGNIALGGLNMLQDG